GEETLLARWPAKSGAAPQMFDGSSQFVTLPGAPEVGNGPLTISVWVKASDLQGGNATWGRGIARSTRGEQVGDWALGVHPDGRVHFCNWRQAGEDPTGSHITAEAVLQPGRWYQITATWDGATNLLFVNGAPVKYTDSTTSKDWGTGHEVGRSWTKPDFYWAG